MKNCTKDELIKIINDAPWQISENQDSTVKLITEKVFEAMKPMLAETRELTKELQGEVLALRTQVSELQAELSKKTLQPVNDEVSKPDYAEAVRKSVQSVFDQEKCKNDVMISKAEEKGEDQHFVKDLCNKLDFETQPIGIMRVGHKSNASNHHRLLKVTFANGFDARSFRARFAERRKAEQGKDHDLPNIHMRAGRSREEQALFKEQGDMVHTLNEAAKKDGDNASFSLRENGQIWKFTKSHNGKWVRDENWKPGN